MRKNIYGLLRIRNEETIIKDTLDHMGTFCKGIFVYDDCSQDNTLSICQSHPSVIKVQEGKQWSINRLDEEYKNRQSVLELARNSVENDCWFIYMDADERIEMDWDLFHNSESNFDKVIMRLWDFYITEEDKCLPYTSRKWVGPEYRDIIFMFRNHPELRYFIPDQRQCATPGYFRTERLGSVKHYGKSVSIEEWEKTCDYYINYFQIYSEKWKLRKGKAIHTKSDFGRDLVLWDDREKNGVAI
jgi:glycosyltransferase involved in cell wall biosynthesis